MRVFVSLLLALIGLPSGAHALTAGALTDRIDAARGAAADRVKALPEADALGKKLRATIDKLDELKKKIVATKEGGAITGEERIREHLDIVYGALMSWEGKPPAYQVERIEVLARELSDVRKDFDSLASRELLPLGEELKTRKLDAIPVASGASMSGDSARIGSVRIP